MDKLIDNLARELASPTSRRGVMRLLGGALLGGLFVAFKPSSLQAQTCSPVCTGKKATCCMTGSKPFCITTGKVCCGNTKCYSGQQCCSGACADAKKVCCGKKTCNTGYFCCNNSTCCKNGQFCVKGRCQASSGNN